MVKGDEGCLSIPEINGEVSRHQWVKVKAQTLDGKEVTVEYEDLPARVMQHEMDHLDGVLFVDRLNPIKRALIYNKLKKLSSYDYTIS
jgi:peptide deformylase